MRGGCPACRGPLAPWRGLYRRCSACGTLALGDDLPLPDLATYEDPSYHESGEGRGAVYHEKRVQVLRRRLERGGVGSRLLEVGCGTGMFADVAARSGFEVTALEPGARYEDARLLLGTAVHRATWEEFLPVREQYDAVCAWEVLEHLANPHAFILAALRALRPGGVLALSTPNARSWSVLLLGHRDPMLCPDEHIQLFTRSALRQLLEECGGERVHLRGFGFVEPDEATRGFVRAVGREPPALIAHVSSLASRLAARSPLALGTEAYVSRS